MDMLKEMAVFAHVVEAEGFSAAARALSLTTSSVSRHVSRLEAHLGARLLQRTTRSVTTTELGRQVYELSANVLANAREITALAGSYTDKPTGVLHVTAPVVLGETWLSPRLPGFLKRHPGVDLRVTLVDRTMDLVEEGVDVAVRISAELAPGLVARPISMLRYVLVASPQYLADNGAPDSPQLLAAHSSVYLGYGRFGKSLTLSRGAESIDVSLKARMTINNSSAIAAVARADGGIGLVPDFAVVDSVLDGSLVPVLPDWIIDKPYLGGIYAVYVPGRHLALKTRAFIDYLSQADVVDSDQDRSPPL